jgi:Uma2 family endonuclease
MMSTAPSKQPRIRSAAYGHDASFPQFSLKKYQRMIDDDILDEQDRVELLENYLVLQTSRIPEHDSVLQTIQMIFMGFLPSGWSLRFQSTVELTNSQPEPDIAVVRGFGRDYLKHPPRAADIGLVIEIANTSLLRDTEDKARIYAGAGIPHYWIINLRGRCCEALSQPVNRLRQTAYRRRRAFRAKESVPFILDSAMIGSIPVRDLLP